MSKAVKPTSSWKPFAKWKEGLQRSGQWVQRGARTGGRKLPPAKRGSPAPKPVARPVREFRCPHCKKKAVV